VRLLVPVLALLLPVPLPWRVLPPLPLQLQPPQKLQYVLPQVLLLLLPQVLLLLQVRLPQVLPPQVRMPQRSDRLPSALAAAPARTSSRAARVAAGSLQTRAEAAGEQENPASEWSGQEGSGI